MTTRAFKAGVTPPAVARAAARKAHYGKRYDQGKLDGWQMNALQRRKDLDRLARYRVRTGAELGSESGWIEVVANYLRVRHGQVDAAAVRKEAAWLGLPALNAQLVDDAVAHIAHAAWGRYQLYSPKLAGDKLRVTKQERIEAKIEKLDAIDETRQERRRRVDRNRKAQQRAAKAAPQRINKSKVAAALGISRAELYRRLASGEVSETDCVRMSNTTYGSNLRTESVSS